MSEFSATPSEMIPFGLSSRYESDIISPSLMEQGVRSVWRLRGGVKIRDGWRH